jgi:flagellar biogenesis protein FliO
VIAASPSALAAQQATPTFLINDSETVTDSLDALSPEFLEEYDRLSGARNSTEPAARNTTLNVDAGSPIGTILVSLLIMVGLVYAGVWGLRHYFRRKSGEMLSPEGKLVFLQETQTLGPNQKLHLLRLGGELLLLGATEHNITCLARYDADQFTKTFDEHLQAAHRTHTTQSAATTPVPLQASLNELRKVQRWQRGDDNA